MARTVLDTPIGGLGVSADAEGVYDVSFGAALDEVDVSDELAAAVAQLREYFAGERTEFDLPLSVRRGSEFERAVWAAIARIPYGETRSYGSIAREVGDLARGVDDPTGARAVGGACNRNPLPIVVPCHRVIGSDGKLVGFGGGLHRKRWLLSLEARVHIERSFGG